jgi:hypothetical protein
MHRFSVSICPRSRLFPSFINSSKTLKFRVFPRHAAAASCLSTWRAARVVAIEPVNVCPSVAPVLCKVVEDPIAARGASRPSPLSDDRTIRVAPVKQAPRVPPEGIVRRNWKKISGLAKSYCRDQGRIHKLRELGSSAFG